MEERDEILIILEIPYPSFSVCRVRKYFVEMAIQS